MYTYIYIHTICVYSIHLSIYIYTALGLFAPPSGLSGLPSQIYIYIYIYTYIYNIIYIYIYIYNVILIPTLDS